MKLEHVTRTQNDGRSIPVTLVTYKDITGHPMASSLHGWLSDQEVKNTLKYYREIDKKQEKFNAQAR